MHGRRERSVGRVGVAEAEREFASESADETTLIGADSLAQRLDVSVRTLWRLRDSGKLPLPIRLGGSLRWRVAEITAWVAAGCPSADEWERRRAV